LQQPEDYRGLFSKALYDLVAFVVPFLLDTVKGILVFLALLLFAWLFRIAGALGVRQEYIDAFEVVHFWSNYGLFIAIALSFGLRMLKAMFRGGS